jgi:general secretion pathway protein H
MRIATSRADAGFTTVEMLAVLVILALAVSAVAYAGSRSMETARFRAFLMETVSLMSAGRAEAMRGMTETVFVIDAENRRLGYKNGKTIDVPEGVAFSSVAAQDELRSDNVVGIRFYPSGETSGSGLKFVFRGQTYEIRVNWLTGNVSLAPV